MLRMYSTEDSKMNKHIMHTQVGALFVSLDTCSVHSKIPWEHDRCNVAALSFIFFKSSSLHFGKKLTCWSKWVLLRRLFLTRPPVLITKNPLIRHLCKRKFY